MTGGQEDQVAALAAEERHRAFARMLHALTRPEAFVALSQPSTGATGLEGEQIEIVQTHASAVVLAGDRAYKLKKPNDFGFFDYSTPLLRRHFCGEEVRLNARLAPDIYLGVAPVVALPDGLYRFGPASAPDALPMPLDEVDGGRIVDYAVVMRRLPEEATLAARVRSDDVRPELLAAVAERVAAFHAASRTDDTIAAFGGVDVITRNWDENFEQMAPYIGRALDAATFERIRAYVLAILRQRRALFDLRMRTGRIRDCHGDLRMQHIYFLDRANGSEHHQERGWSPSTDASEDSGASAVSPSSPRSPAIIDCIEFNERFRYGDVAAEVAFLTMELDAASRSDLARTFVNAYVAQTGDEALRELLPFYACYRACVRGKVLAFQLDEHEVPEDQREVARQQAHIHFALAARYATGPTAPTLLLASGLMGTGKTTLARRLAHEVGYVLISSDATRKEQAGVALTQPRAEAFGQGLYSQDWTARTYRALLEHAAAALAEGRSVILDASFARRADRQAAAKLAADAGAAAWLVECVCPREVALARLAHRWRAKQSDAPVSEAAAPTAPAAHETPESPSVHRAPDASDGRPELYDAQAAAWQPFDASLEPGVVHLRVETQGSVASSVAHVLDALDITTFACWL